MTELSTRLLELTGEVRVKLLPDGSPKNFRIEGRSVKGNLIVGVFCDNLQDGYVTAIADILEDLGDTITIEL